LLGIFPARSTTVDNAAYDSTGKDEKMKVEVAEGSVTFV
jgi:hypothetical protein